MRTVPTLWVVPLAVLGFSLPASAQNLTRGPYLQQGTESGVVVRWRTDATSAGRVRYGAEPGLLTAFADGPSATEHEIKLTGLSPNTTYYYSVGTSAKVLAGGDASHFFLTAPPRGWWKSTRVWVIGDAGTKFQQQRDVRDAYYAFTGPRHTDLWLMLGDNAYLNGTEEDYQAAVFDTYGAMLRKSVVWPTLGNHDALSATSATQSGVYYGIFTLPRNGEAGGVASGTEAYYSFDYANIHFICLDSEDSSRSATGPMATWLESDLAATAADWIVAFWHHPPYSKGSHNSDTSSQLGEMRQRFLPVLEKWGVDLVLCGHSHSYERSVLLDSHYGLSSTLTAAMKKDPGNGREGETGAYRKSEGNGPHEGAVYVVAGSSGHVSGSGSLNHPVTEMPGGRVEAATGRTYMSWFEVGSLVLDITRHRMDAKFVRGDGLVRDHFTVIKGSDLPAVTVRVSDPSASEVGGDPGRIVVTRTGQTASPLAVRFALGGSATPGSDFAPVGAAVTVPAGASSGEVVIAPLADAVAEGVETVVLTLSASAEYVVGDPGGGQVSIADAGAPPPPPEGQGLLGEYYNTWNLQGPSLSRVDPAVDFDWGIHAPLPGINADGFGVRWTGSVTPEFTETYTFYTLSNEGARLWVNDALVIDKGVDQPLTEWSGRIDLVGGRRCALRLEYYDNTGEAAMRLSWEGPSTPKAVVPAARLTPPGGAAPAPSGGGGGGGSGCGFTGVEALSFLALLLRRRRSTA